LNVVQTIIKEIKHGENNCTGTALLVGIPNVGKSAIVNAMHQIGRIAAAGDICRSFCCSVICVTSVLVGFLMLYPNACCLSREGKAEACDCEQPSWRN
jgi:hypothetical protein